MSLIARMPVAVEPPRKQAVWSEQVQSEREGGELQQCGMDICQVASAGVLSAL